ncbi:MAG: peptidoglycan DD-metalloendopeptidase family protein [Lachnospiraceae bacterium]|nr:peptidoglycan DD-metalloendopeptidase family protein [Lachnospiraceae bacterium]
MNKIFNKPYKRRLRMLVFVTLAIILSVLVYKGESWYISHGKENVVEVSNSNPVLTGTSTQIYKYVNPYYAECEYVYDDTMYEDEVEITQEEEAGTKETTVVETFYNGDIQERKMLDSEIIDAAVPRVVHIGTKERLPYILPVENYILSSGFGPRWGTNHNGIDMAVPTGTEVMASADGIVIQSGWNGGYGISVYIDHENGVITRYGHMSQTLVSVGQRVSQGDIIGLSGSTGDSTGPHVHFEMRENDVPIDPIRYVNY